MKTIACCRCASLADTVCCTPVQMRDYSLQSLCIGPTGAFAITDSVSEADLDAIYIHLRDFLGTSRICLYIAETGILYPARSENTLPSNQVGLKDMILSHTQNERPLLWSADMVRKLSDKIRYEDARNRGVYCNDEGVYFVAHNGKFRPMSNKDANSILRLALYGGILGAHRFALGKWFSALAYLLTGGLMGLGWLMDLLQIHLGSMRDREKGYLVKPESLPLSRYLIGIGINTVLFCSYSVIASWITGIRISW